MPSLLVIFGILASAWGETLCDAEVGWPLEPARAPFQDFESLIQVTQTRKSTGYYKQVLHNTDDLQYTGDVKINGQSLQAVLDTGSFDILAFSKDCGSCGKAGKLSCEEPSCTVHNDQAFEEEYGSGSAKAKLANTTVIVGQNTVENHEFFLATSANMPILKFADFQAIVGIGPPDNTEQLLDKIGMRYFSACLQAAKGSKGYLIWNDKAPQEQPVPFTKVPVAGHIFWGVEMSQTRFSGSQGDIDLACNPSCGAVLDTGTSLIAVPTAVYNKALDKLIAMGADCDHVDELPDLVFKLGGHEYSLPPQAYIGEVVEEMPFWPAWLPFKPVTTECQLLLMDLGEMPPTDKGPMWILGMPFFRYYYTTFDLGTDPLNTGGRSVYTAPASASCQPSARNMAKLRLQSSRKQPLWKVNASKVLAPHWLKPWEAQTHRADVTPF